MRARKKYRTMLFVVVLAWLSGSAAGGAATPLGPKDGFGLAATDLERVRVGEPAPDFTLQDQDGAPVTLSAFRGERDVVLVFYRGHW
jgi:cytochrome oxidase Cu insertion factor (SCO1/SenC/PrrC family)